MEFFEIIDFEIIGYLIGFFIGMVMGLIGGGGSLLLPTLIYLFDIESTLATAYTLVLVGVTALIGVLPRIKSKRVDFPTAITLGIPILLGTLLVRGWLTHELDDFEIGPEGKPIPLVLFELLEFEFTKRKLVLLVFASVLIASFASMIGLIGRNMKARPKLRQESPVFYFSMLIGAGLFIGVLSAFIGAGGGVMIVPLLVIVMGLPMKTVVGTSLAIMAGKSILGFSGDVFQIGQKIQWDFLGAFAFVMIGGILVGTYCSKFVSSAKLKTGFAWFILAMAIFIFYKELMLPGVTGK